MKWYNIDFDTRNIHLLDTKTGDKRDIPISDELYKVLQSIHRESEYVFINSKTKAPYVDIKKSFNTVREYAGIEDFRFHDLRHTFATRSSKYNNAHRSQEEKERIEEIEA